jgi:hypothetical protein
MDFRKSGHCRAEQWFIANGHAGLKPAFAFARHHVAT